MNTYDPTPADVAQPESNRRPLRNFKIYQGRFYPDHFGNIWELDRVMPELDFSHIMKCVEVGATVIDYRNEQVVNHTTLQLTRCYRPDGLFSHTRDLPHDLKQAVPYVRQKGASHE